MPKKFRHNSTKKHSKKWLMEPVGLYDIQQITNFYKPFELAVEEPVHQMISSDISALPFLVPHIDYGQTDIQTINQNFFNDRYFRKYFKSQPSFEEYDLNSFKDQKMLLSSSLYNKNRRSKTSYKNLRKGRIVEVECKSSCSDSEIFESLVKHANKHHYKRNKHQKVSSQRISKLSESDSDSNDDNYKIKIRQKSKTKQKTKKSKKSQNIPNNQKSENLFQKDQNAEENKTSSISSHIPTAQQALAQSWNVFQKDKNAEENKTSSISSHIPTAQQALAQSWNVFQKDQNAEENKTSSISSHIPTAQQALAQSWNVFQKDQNAEENKASSISSHIPTAQQALAQSWNVFQKDQNAEENKASSISSHIPTAQQALAQSWNVFEKDQNSEKTINTPATNFVSVSSNAQSGQQSSNNQLNSQIVLIDNSSTFTSNNKSKSLGDINTYYKTRPMTSHLASTLRNVVMNDYDITKNDYTGNEIKTNQTQDHTNSVQPNHLIQEVNVQQEKPFLTNANRILTENINESIKFNSPSAPRKLSIGFNNLIAKSINDNFNEMEQPKDTSIGFAALRNEAENEIRGNMFETEYDDAISLAASIGLRPEVSNSNLPNNQDVPSTIDPIYEANPPAPPFTIVSTTTEPKIIKPTLIEQPQQQNGVNYRIDEKRSSKNIFKRLSKKFQPLRRK